MLIDIDKQGVHVVAPGSFRGLMAVYESNWRRLVQLFGRARLREMPEEAVSAVPGDLDLHLEVQERSPYTTTFRLTYYFDAAGETDADPDLVVRVYHDAQLAEVLSCRRLHHRHHLLGRYATNAQDELARRWQRNILLNKWLEYCLERGHSFDF
ncbi:MAG TPA: DUF1249 domain-containing protein [Gammaproteobacteria bacterium]